VSSFASPMDLEAAQHAGHVADSPSALIEAVRRATDVFRDVRNAAPEYGPILGCVSGPDQGAMGVHFANPALLEDDVLDAAHPEALIYEFKDGVARLVGVEFIVIADVAREPRAARSARPRGPATSVRRQSQPLRITGVLRAPRVGVAEQPQRRIVDWNPRVSCEAQ
jgi:hypothetical protein